MKIKWDKQYLKISLYVIFIGTGIYALSKVVDSAAYIVTNFGKILSGFSDGFSSVFSVFSVFVIAFIIAYLLDPLVDFFQNKYERFSEKRLTPFIKKIKASKNYKKTIGTVITKYRKIKPKKEKVVKEKKQPAHKTRSSGTALTYICIFLIVFLGIGSIIRRLGGGGEEGLASSLSKSLVQFMNKTINDLGEFYAAAQITLAEWGVSDQIANYISKIVDNIQSLFTSLPTNIVARIASAGGVVANFLISLVVSFYFLRDKENIKAKTKELMELFLSEKMNRRITNFFADIHAVFSNYIRGQLTDAVIMGFLISVALSIIGVDFALFIGVFSGFSNLIPYFGAIIGFILSVSVALLSGEPVKALWAAIAVLILQQIDGMFIVPKVVGEKVELSPAVVLLSLSVFGGLFGILGMVLAVPATAIIKMFAIRFTDRYKKNKEDKMKKIAESKEGSP